MEEVVKALFEKYTRGEGTNKYNKKKVLNQPEKGSLYPNCNKNNNGLDWLYSAKSDTGDFVFFPTSSKTNTFDFIVKNNDKFSCLDIDLWYDDKKIGCEFDGPHHYFMGSFYRDCYRQYRNTYVNKLIKKKVMKKRKEGYLEWHSSEEAKRKKSSTPPLQKQRIEPSKDGGVFYLCFIPYFIVTAGLSVPYVKSRILDSGEDNLVESESKITDENKKGTFNYIIDIEDDIYHFKPHDLPGVAFTKHNKQFDLKKELHYYYSEILKVYFSIITILKTLLKPKVLAEMLLTNGTIVYNVHTEIAQQELFLLHESPSDDLERYITRLVNTNITYRATIQNLYNGTFCDDKLHKEPEMRIPKENPNDPEESVGSPPSVMPPSVTQSSVMPQSYIPPQASVPPQSYNPQLYNYQAPPQSYIPPQLYNPQSYIPLQPYNPQLYNYQAPLQPFSLPAVNYHAANYHAANYHASNYSA